MSEDTDKHERHELGLPVSRDGVSSLTSLNESNLHHSSHLVIIATPLSHERVDFVDEDDARLQLLGEREEAGDELVRFSEPLVGQAADLDVDEGGATLLGERFGEHGLAASWGAVKENSLGRAEQASGRLEDLGVAEGEDDRFSELRDDGIQSANVCNR